MINECDGLCSICKYRNTPIDGEHCGPCGYDFANFIPDWVGLICTHFHVSRNQAKRMYHNMVADWRIRKEMDKIIGGIQNDNK